MSKNKKKIYQQELAKALKAKTKKTKKQKKMSKEHELFQQIDEMFEQKDYQ